LFFIYVFIYFLNYITPVIADDYDYAYIYNTGNLIKNVGDIITSQINHYFVWGGRNIVHFLAQLFILIGDSLFNFINAFGYIILIILVYIHCTGNIKIHKDIKISLLIGINLLLWFFIPSFGQDILWITGSANYLWGMIIILLYLLPFRLRNEASSYKWQLKAVLMFVGGIISGWTNESMSGAMILLIILYMFYYRFNKIKIPKWLYVGLIGSLIGFIVMLAAPGNYVRIESFATNVPFINRMISKFVLCSGLLVFNTGFLVAIYTFMNVFLYNSKIKNKIRIFFESFLYFIGSVAAIYAMMLSPYFPDRAWFGIIVFMVISIGTLYSKLQHNDKLLRQLVIVSLVFMLPVFIYTYINASKDIYQTKVDINERISVIESERKKGNKDLYLKVIVPKSRYNALYGLVDIGNDKTVWPNTTVATYFDIDYVTGYSAK
jgi:hypothetical protein